MQIVEATPRTVNNNYNTILINLLDPISLHPSDPGFEECMADFVSRLHAQLGDGDHHVSQYSSICQRVATDFLFGGEKVRYLTTDLARKKGVYKAPDGKLRFDPKQGRASSFYRRGVGKDLCAVSPEYQIEVVSEGGRQFCDRVASNGYTSYKKVAAPE